MFVQLPSDLPDESTTITVLSESDLRAMNKKRALGEEYLIAHFRAGPRTFLQVNLYVFTSWKEFTKKDTQRDVFSYLCLYMYDVYMNFMYYYRGLFARKMTAVTCCSQ